MQFKDEHFLVLLGVALLILTGCEPRRESPESPETHSANSEGVTLRVLVLDDPAIADALRRRLGEWDSVSDDRLEILETRADDVFATPDSTAPFMVNADVLIYPSRLLGELAKGERIIPLRRSVLQSKEFAAGDIFPLILQREITWGGRAMAVPLGSPVFVLYWRKDIFEQHNLRPPTTWSEYQRTVDKLNRLARPGVGANGDAPATNKSDRASSNAPGDSSSTSSDDSNAKLTSYALQYATVEPTAEGWAWRTFLARAAAYAKDRDHFSTLLDVETAEPLIDRPPFVRALREMIAATGPRKEAIGQRERPIESGAETAGLTLSQVMNLFLSGKSAMAIGWPVTVSDGRTAVDLDFGVASLPGAEEVYVENSTRKGRWTPRDERRRRVTTLPLAGRLSSVTSSCKNAPAAFRFLIWAASGRASDELCLRSEATTLFRNSQRASAARWLRIGRPLATTAPEEYFEAVRDSLSQEDCLLALRIPGAERYHRQLDRAVRQALRGEQTPEKALAAAAEAWRAITEEMGAARQRQAYRRGLGLAGD